MDVKIPSEATIRALCGMRSVPRDALRFLGGGREDSDGVVYRFFANGAERVFKVISVETAAEQPPDSMRERIEFIRYLGENGVCIAYPLPGADGGLYAACREGKLLYIAYETPLAPGKNPENAELTPALARTWGAVVGKTHRLTRGYPVWKNLRGGTNEYGYLDEMDFFENWCRNETVKGHWRTLRRQLTSLPISRDSYGFIHNDIHQRNILWDGERTMLIDFDCAGCNFFMQDIVTPMQGLMFDVSGGLMSPVYNEKPLRTFHDAFMDGYETENHLDEFWLRQINAFVDYRRILLYTCMQDWLSTVPELEKGMLDMMARHEPVIRR